MESTEADTESGVGNETDTEDNGFLIENTETSGENGTEEETELPDIALEMLGKEESIQMASQDDIEANGTFLTLNQSEAGVLTAEKEEKWYKFAIAQAGYFQMEFGAATTLKSVTGGKKKETIKGTKVKGVTGYYVYCSTSKNGKYKKIETIKKAGTTSYTDKKSLKSNKKYYYKVVTYHTANGVTATGKASKIKGAKTN